MALRTPIDESTDEIREALRPLRRDFSVAVVAAGNEFAIGAIIRVAHSFLAREIILVGCEPHYEKASMGMAKYETIVRLADERAFADYAKGRPVFAFERETAMQSIYTLEAFPPGVILLFGSERFGLSSNLLHSADKVLAIPMHGVNQSFPLAIAAGIAMSEWSRRFELTPKAPVALRK